ncbi:MAG: response regulator, partial [Candidatus Electrothrix sp. AX2]|nr:response regulator [Candidatus Electrothrix gigas]
MKQQVLIVDDEPELLLSIKSGFEKEDRFHLTTAHNGQEALDVLSRIPVDLVVTDLRMSVMDGVELLASMTKSFPKVPKAVMTMFGTLGKDLVIEASSSTPSITDILRS